MSQSQEIEEKIQRDAAHKKPHYWIALRGAEIWNRWARGDYTKEMWEVRRKEVEKSPRLSDVGKERWFEAWEEFRELNVQPLTAKERAAIEHDIQKYCVMGTEFPSPASTVYLDSIEWDFLLYTEHKNKGYAVFGVDFSHFIFPAEVRLGGTYFPHHVTFEKAKFFGKNHCESIEVQGFADFNEVAFYETAIFKQAHFHAAADFGGAIFNGVTMFNKSRFYEQGRFHYAKSLNYIAFNEATFGGNALFEGMLFMEEANFLHTDFARDLILKEASFTLLPPTLNGAKIGGILNVIRTKWPDANKSRRDAAEIALAYSQLKRRMEELKLHDLELEFHAKELDAKSHDTKNFILKRWLIVLYDVFSGYGLSIIRPVLWLFFLLGGATLVYVAFFRNVAVSADQVNRLAIYAAAHYTLPFIPIDSDVQKNLLDIISVCTQEKQVSASCLQRFDIIRSVHTFFSLICLFLIGLGLRNRLRLR